ncbi:unnamed protein product, partial [Musa banksii]
SGREQGCRERRRSRPSPCGVSRQRRRPGRWSSRGQPPWPVRPSPGAFAPHSTFTALSRASSRLFTSPHVASRGAGRPSRATWRKRIRTTRRISTRTWTISTRTLTTRTISMRIGASSTATIRRKSPIDSRVDGVVSGKMGTNHGFLCAVIVHKKDKIGSFRFIDR